MKLVLGSANFGTSYGLLNKKKKISSFEKDELKNSKPTNKPCL